MGVFFPDAAGRYNSHEAIPRKRIFSMLDFLWNFEAPAGYIAPYERKSGRTRYNTSIIAGPAWRLIDDYPLPRVRR
jgi:hypothetical protein